MTFIVCTRLCAGVDAEWICPVCPHRKGCEDHKKYEEAEALAE